MKVVYKKWLRISSAYNIPTLPRAHAHHQPASQALTFLPRAQPSLTAVSTLRQLAAVAACVLMYFLWVSRAGAAGVHWTQSKIRAVKTVTRHHVCSAET